ncbi:hypothetical protein TNCV_4392691 [Trichonephila clavipes]|nr:hypothetical protein TNCV_4392691 [Trichonephila clavipes]
MFDDTLDCLTKGAKFFLHGSRSGYWQIGNEQADREKDGIYYMKGLYESCRFGLCNTAKPSKRMMDLLRILNGL